jgi:predicted outer membrane repeat protein
VNGSSGNDAWNGQSSTYQSGITGPKKSIKNATGTITKYGTIKIANGVYSGIKNTNITITKSMTIIGQTMKGTIINGTNTNTIFLIKPGVILNLNNLTITNGVSKDSSGSITNLGTLTVSKCYFSYNKADIGGAILNHGNLKIDQTSFYKNHAVSGGAVFNNGILQLSDSAFIGNSGKDGGAIYSFEKSFNVTNCSFKNNYATGAGGAICKNGGIMNVNSTIFTGNSGFAGGALYSILNITNITLCKFSNNGKLADNTMGGGIYLYGGKMVVKYSTFISNIGSQGGAIENGDTMQVVGCIFLKNKASDVGGVIMNDYLTHLTVKSSTFLLNGGTSYGGNVLYNGGTANLHYNIIIATGSVIFDDGGVADVSYNWWGSNHPNFSSIILNMGGGKTTYKPWIYMTFKTVPAVIYVGSKGTKLVVSFNQVFNGKTLESIDPANGHIPDGTAVNFKAGYGNLKVWPEIGQTNNGIATAIFKSNILGKILLTANTDSQTLNSTVTVLPNKNTFNENNKTVGMQDTGLPIAPLALVAISLVAGLTYNKKR